MSLPEQVEQVVQRIIAHTAPNEPELHSIIHDELQEQFEALLQEEVLRNLSDDQAEAFQHLIAQETPDQAAISQFLVENHINTTHITNLALNHLQEQYLEEA